MLKTGQASKKIIYSHLILLSILWVFCVMLVNPAGEFPLNDDWSYARVVQTILNEGRFQLTGWTSMPLIGQAFWGALFCLPFGFSFTALRLSTLVLGLIGVLSTYGLLKEAKAGLHVAFFGALLLALNPLYFQHAFTFMTDVPFAAMALLAVYLYMRGFRTQRPRDFIMGSIIAGFASLIRQLGVVIPVAFGLVFLLKFGFNKKSFKKVLYQLCLSVFPLVLFQLWLQFSHGLPARYNAASERMARSLAEGMGSYLVQLVQRTSGGLIYVGLFILPFLFWAVYMSRSRFKKTDLYLSLSFLSLMVLALSLVWRNRSMPLLKNVMFDFGLGPPHLRDVYVLGLPNWPQAPAGFWFLVTITGVICAAFLIYVIFISLKKFWTWMRGSEKLDENILLHLGVFLLYFLPIIIIGYYDRYLILLPSLMMVLIVLLFPVLKKKSPTTLVLPIIFTLIVYGGLTVGATHDYMSWNRARWEALDFLTEEMGILPRDIDGGFEFNGWHLYDPGYIQQENKSYWWIEEDSYVVSFGPMAGYKEIRRFPFKRWLPPETAHIRILRRSDREME